MTDRRDAIAEDLRSLATDLRSLVDSATTDPKERRKKERQWRALYGALSILTALAARQAANRAWAILTGEQPPPKGGGQVRSSAPR
jgi:hypothetical protein